MPAMRGSCPHNAGHGFCRLALVPEHRHCRVCIRLWGKFSRGVESNGPTAKPAGLVATAHARLALRGTARLSGFPGAQAHPGISRKPKHLFGDLGRGCTADTGLRRRRVPTEHRAGRDAGVSGDIRPRLSGLDEPLCKTLSNLPSNAGDYGPMRMMKPLLRGNRMSSFAGQAGGSRTLGRGDRRCHRRMNAFGALAKAVGTKSWHDDLGPAAPRTVYTHGAEFAKSLQSWS